jgi:hypothetical protein
MSQRTWDIGVVKVIREKYQATALAVGRKCRKHRMADSFEVLHSNRCEYSTDKMV